MAAPSPQQLRDLALDLAVEERPSSRAGGQPDNRLDRWARLEAHGSRRPGCATQPAGPARPYSQVGEASITITRPQLP